MGDICKLAVSQPVLVTQSNKIFAKRYMKRYSSLYPNHVHQVAVSVSKHLYSTRLGKLKFQIKPFDVSLLDPPAEKEHIVIFAIRDHCSGISYAEVRPRSQLGTLRGFLGRAWAQKATHPFCGVPEILLYSKTMEATFPGTGKAVEDLGVQVLSVASGFQTNIGDIRVVESRLKLMDGEPITALQTFGQDWSAQSASEVSRVSGKTKLDLWNSCTREIFVPSELWGTT